MLNYTNRTAFIAFLLSLFAISSNGQLVANFTASQTAGCPPLIVTFTNTSTGTNSSTTYNWDFGNSATSLLGSPPQSTSYTLPNTYTVTLTVHNGSIVSTKTMTITVHPPPVVDFIANDTAVCPGTAVSFLNTTNPNAPGTSTYYWDFGDGFSSALQSPPHTFPGPGYYNITLKVTNSYGCISSVTKNAYIHVLNNPTAGFTVSNSYFCKPPATVTFTNTSTGTPTLMGQWYFGNGGSLVANSPTYTYNASGAYNVKLIETDGNGCKDSITQLGAVYVGNLTAAFTGPSTACIYSNVNFVNTSNNLNATAYWDFGDNSGVFIGTNASHAYASSGPFNVRLIIYDGHCYDTIINPITILPEPVSSFTYTPIHPCPAPISVQFNSTGPAGSTYSWNFGDGLPGSTSANPNHTFQTDAFDTVTMVLTNTSGCSDTVQQVVYIYNLFGDFTTSPDTPAGCMPLTVTFHEHAVTNTQNLMFPIPYPYPVTNYSWDFGDGSAIINNTLSTMSHIYTTLGEFHMHVTMTTQNGCTWTDSINVWTGTPPILDSYSITPPTICKRDSIHFVAHVHGNQPFTYIWHFGIYNPPQNHPDSAITTDSTFTYNYDTPGVWHPYIIVMNHGCRDTTTVFNVTVTIDSPKSNFHVHSKCDSPLTVFMANVSTGADSVRWFFSDGTSTNAYNPAPHTFPSAGNWDVKLVAYNIKSGCKDTLDTTVVLVNLMPTFVANDTAICKDGTVTFTPTIPGGPPPLHSLWFVDGSFVVDSVELIHLFDGLGRHTIKLVTIDIYNCVDSFVRQNYILVAKPTDSFYAVPVQGCRPLHVDFYDSSKDVPGTYIVSRSWNFGDNTSGTTTGPDTSHLYTVTGSYNIETIVTDNLGCKDTLDQPAYINVFHPVPGFTASNLFPCPGSSVVFNNTSSGNITNAYWWFGDGDTSTSISPTHIYYDTGYYTIKLVVWDALGCKDSITVPSYLYVTKPHASFTVSDTTGICIPLNAQFTNTSIGAVSYNWDLGNGNTSLAPNPSGSYSIPSSYTVVLVATNSHGCKDTATKHVNLYGYAGSFTYSPLIGCKPLLVNFTANVLNIPQIFWDFSDGTVIGPDTALTASHTYFAAGAYVPKLILKDSSGCTASSQGLDTIKVDEVKPGYKTMPYPICIYDTVSFIDTSHSLFSVINSWKWTFNDGQTSSTSTAQHYYGSSGTFAVSLVVTDSLTCTDTLIDSVIVNPLPIIKACNDTIICLGDAAQLSASGGVSYLWGPAATLSCTNCSTPKANPTVFTQYFVTGTDANGCKNTDTTSVGLKTQTVSYPGKDKEICEGQSVQISDSAADTYTWVPSTGLTDDHTARPFASPSISTQYMVIAWQGSCIPDTNYIEVVVHPRPKVNAGSSVTIIENTSTTLQASGSNVRTYVWSPVYGLSCDSCSNPTVKIPKTTTFTVTAYSNYGCVDSDKVTVNVICDKGQVFIPNSFTPNGDGQNDIFYPRGVGIDKIKSFRIYDRWGELIFERKNIDLNDESSAWDGTYKGAKPRPDVYVYAVDAICESGEEISWKGDVTIIR